MIEVSDKDKSMLMPMMSANVEVLTKLREGVLIVPSEAVRTKGGETGVYKLINNTPEWKKTLIGESNGILTEIRNGIEEGDEIVVSGMEGIKENNRSGRGIFRRRH